MAAAEAMLVHQWGWQVSLPCPHPQPTPQDCALLLSPVKGSPVVLAQQCTLPLNACRPPQPMLPPGDVRFGQPLLGAQVSVNSRGTFDLPAGDLQADAVSSEPYHPEQEEAMRTVPASRAAVTLLLSSWAWPNTREPGSGATVITSCCLPTLKEEGAMHKSRAAPFRARSRFLPFLLASQGCF